MFTLDAYDHVETLASGQGRDIEYPRDIWHLRKLGIDRPAAATSFEQIRQPWLKALVKGWARWQLTLQPEQRHGRPFSRGAVPVRRVPRCPASTA